MEFEGQYLNYDEYQELGGTLTEMPFNVLEFEARQVVDMYTFGRLKNLDEQTQEVKMCINKLIGTMNTYNSEVNNHIGVASESTDGYSVSYENTSSDLIKAKENEVKNIVKEYLVDCKLEDGTPYMYCGAR